jgi:hypothetical protein
MRLRRADLKGKVCASHGIALSEMATRLLPATVLAVSAEQVAAALVAAAAFGVAAPSMDVSVGVLRAAA